MARQSPVTTPLASISGGPPVVITGSGRSASGSSDEEFDLRNNILPIYQSSTPVSAARAEYRPVTPQGQEPMRRRSSLSPRPRGAIFRALALRTPLDRAGDANAAPAIGVR